MDALRSNIYFLKQSNLIAHKHRHDGFYVFYISISYSLVDFAHKMAEPRINCYKGHIWYQNDQHLMHFNISKIL